MRTIQGLLITTMVILSLGSVTAYAQGSETQASEVKSKADQRKEFERVKASIAKLKRELEKTKSNHDSLQNQLEQNEREIQKLDGKTRELKSNLKNTQSELDTLKQKQGALNTEKQQQEALVEDYINAAYRLGKQNEIRLIFNQQDPSESARMLKYFQAFSTQRRTEIAKFVDTLAQLHALESNILAGKAELERTQASLLKKKRALAQRQKDRRSTLSQMEQKLANKQQRLASLAKDRERLETVLNTVYEELGSPELALDFDSELFSQLKGRLLRPTRGRVLNRFGRKRAGTHVRWQGLEFDGPRGSDIFAIHHGRVVFSDYLRGHGLIIIVDHGAGFMSLYAHASNLFKELGDWVTAGEVIASLGDTGGRKRPALYFEIRHNGKPTDPSPWLKNV